MRNSKLKSSTILFIVLFTISFSTIFSYGAGTGAGAALSQIRSARYAASGGIETVTINIDHYEDVQSFMLAEPLRFVIDIKGAALPPGLYALDIGKGSVLRLRYSMFDTQTARFVIDLSRGATFSLKTGKGFIKAEAITGAADADAIICTPDYGGASAAAATTANTTATNNNSGDDSFTAVISKPQTTVIPDNAPAAGNAVSGDSQSPPKRTPRPTRIPVDIAPTPTPGRLATPRIPPSEQTPMPSPQQTAEPEPLVIPPPIITKDEFKLDITSGLRISATIKEGTKTCVVEMPKGLASKAVVSDLSNPQYITIDVPIAIPGGIAGAKTMHVNSDVLRDVTVSLAGAGLLRIAMNIQDRVTVSSAIEGDKLVFNFVNGIFHNVGYHKNGERAFITLYQTALTSGSERLNEFYVPSTADDGKTWTVAFDNDRGLVGEGAATIDDNLLHTIGVYKKGGKTYLVVAAKEKVRLVIYTKNVAERNILETTVSIIRPVSGAEQAIVIDAGHGGHDPGAIGLTGRSEKDVNLDIAIKLAERLSQQAGLRVFLTRDGDYFVDLYERAQLANELKADLFVSIHANASSTNPEANGIETLYFPADADEGVFTSKLFAGIVQKRLISFLRVTDRGIVPRPNLVVLRRTDMPAILVETAFMTNANDMLNLSRSAYRKNTANIIADAALEALKFLRK